ncbi:hypothetical protein BD309DRAFT_1014862 [Dichomitus squalens]|uniref:Uncharacterized protein n=1 Tax=Dichomitus squalens TaxID=114155 RepID=A0A4Q9P5G6_9APHY|nr:hypothetical protein BD309DRAFT_1014862 [Dichomitus squalens]TBU63982.1 hypothetical protein BD310DRAFT_973029 [Dichomitus squalens]
MPLFTFWQGQGMPQGVTTLAMPGTHQAASQWIQAAQFQAPPQQQQPLVAPSAPTQPSLDDIVDTVVAKLEKNKHEIAPSHSNDKTVVDALKRGRGKGRTPREALEELGDTHGYTNNMWKDYFLDRVEKLFPEALSTSATTIARSPRPGSTRTISRKPPSQTSLHGLAQYASPTITSKNTSQHSAHTTGESSGERFGRNEDNADADDQSSSESSESSVNDLPPRHTAAYGVQVTEDDVRRMARYMYERRKVWAKCPSFTSRWAAFARRPENQKRSVDGWRSVERRREQDIQRYYNEYAAVRNKTGIPESGSKLNHIDTTTLPQQYHTRECTPRVSTSSSSRTIKEDILNSVFSRKRGAPSEAARSANTYGGSPVAKRIKKARVTKEPVELSSD